MSGLDELTETQLEQQAQRAGELRLAYCGELMFAEENGEPNPQPGEHQEPCGPYDGCDTCIVREVLDAAWPIMLELAKREVAGENRCGGCHRSIPPGYTYCVRCAPPVAADV